MIHRQRLQRQFPDQSMGVLLKIEGNCSCLKAKVAHMVGHLPATLVRTNFTRATLVKAELDGANFHQAILWQANLRNAFLSSALFNYTDLEEANLSHATVDLTIFGDVDLRNVRGLKSIRHQGPSLVSTTALVRSQGDIPEIFLRKAGVPDSFIEYSHSLLTNPIEYYTCFISYSSRDQAFAERVYADLQNKGVRCWFAPEDMKIGDKIRPRIDEAIRIHDKLLLVLSKHSVESDWVEKEVETALEKERQQNKSVLFPIRLDDTVMITSRVYIIASLFFTEGTLVPFFHRNRVWIPIPLEGTAGNTHSFLSVVVYVNKNKCVEQPTIKALSLVESNGFWQWHPAIRLFTMRRSA